MIDDEDTLEFTSEFVEERRLLSRSVRTLRHRQRPYRPPSQTPSSLLTFSGYQIHSKETAQEWADPDVNSRTDHKITALFLATALNGETGELSEKIKKFVREDDEGYLEEAQAELGDVLWYLAQIASLLDVDLGTVARDNLVKLEDREERDVILGQGDDR